MRSILIQQIYPDTPGVKLLELTREWHQRYCDTWFIDYKSVIENPCPSIPPEAGSWGKVELIRQALKKYDHVYWLDADALIVDIDTHLRDAVTPYKIGACWHRIPQGAHWNIGCLYVDNTDATRHFFNKWLASYPPKVNGHNWMEQGVFNDMARQGREVVTISDRWNATYDVNMVPDAVVLGFHGQGDVEYRYKLMKQALDKIANKKATTQAMSEV